jgi:hypothetical protein
MKGETPPILQRDDRGTVAILTMNRPAKLNALSNELLAAIMEMLDSIELDATSCSPRSWKCWTASSWTPRYGSS